MNNKIDLLYGAIIGSLTTLLGSYLFIKIFTNYDFAYALEVMKTQGFLVKLFALGAFLNIPIIYYFFKIKKDSMAYGVFFPIIILAIISVILL